MNLRKIFTILYLLANCITSQVLAQVNPIDQQLEKDTTAFGLKIGSFNLRTLKWFQPNDESVDFLNPKCSYLAEQVGDAAFTFLGIKAQRLFWALDTDSTIIGYYAVLPYSTGLANKIVSIYGNDYWASFNGSQSGTPDLSSSGSISWRYNEYRIGLNTQRNQLSSGDYDDTMVVRFLKIKPVARVIQSI
ncbi:hypothetical protein KTO58_14295 [Chitinophaga pendula]|uniref:hypothetical protein n=1 Tax=Chitinophaga TaxID=79328 RepID=UPI000BAF2C5B|nr:MULTISPECIES: hypothetical protein [Chitinophaga]ASZ12089.1 hypothetical protein CK934_14530 [Chitinophaga sp. MD30]UCJ04873.1 hypothetical protein KTO58_14295 [Chitinophaga pendula]